MAFTTFFELISERTFTSPYMDILLTKLYLKEPTFSALLSLCNQDFQYIDFATLKAYNSLFVSKILIVFMLTWVVTWLKRQREKEENDVERIQRAKNYLLEDYLEEKKLTMMDLVEIEGNEELQQCMEMLKSCKYDYERYKIQRQRKLEEELRDKPIQERSAFLDEVKRFKEEISEKEQICEGNYPLDFVDTDRLSEGNTPHASNGNLAENSIDTAPTIESKPETPTPNIEKPTEDIREWQYFFTIERPEYFYVLLQTFVFTIMALLIHRLKYVLTPFLCVIASTFPPKSLKLRNFNLWLIYAIVIGSCMLDRGLQNVREQYNFDGKNDLYDAQEQSDLHDMLKWIKSNTDRTDVFAGPNDIIGLVLLATGRPISNNPISVHPQMIDRLKTAYSMMSKRDSNSVYIQLAELKIDYIIVSHRDCFGNSRDSCKISTISDIIQPENQNNIQLCADLFQRANLNFLKIFVNDHFMILKIFERFQVDLKLIQSQMPEKSM